MSLELTDHALRAGPMDLLVDGCDVRYLRLGTTELVRRVYAAVRDPDWSTIPGTVEAFDLVRDGDDAFTVRMQVRHSSPDVDLRWTGEITGAADGAVRLSFDGEALADTTYNRIGFCVLHPIAGFAGGPFRAQTEDGEIAGTLPDLVAPQRFENGHYVPLFPSFSRLELEHADGTALELTFRGDLFETEDQRNWTDASLKTYCTPLSRGFPHRLAAGEHLRQEIEVRVRSGGRRPITRTPTPGAAERVVVAIADTPSGTMPPIGTVVRDPSAARDASAAIGALGLAHARIDAHCERPGWEAALREQLEVLAALGLPAEVALHVGAAEALTTASELLAGRDVARVFAFVANAGTATPEETTTPTLAAALREALGGLGCPLGAGTDMAFCELNRTRPPLSDIDGIAFPIVAETHAFDDRSLVETLGVQGETVRGARAFAPERAVHVTPVTFLARFNQHATRPHDAAEQPSDPRLRAPFGAAWTVGSVAALAAAGAASLTYFEATGPNGVVGAPVASVISTLTALRGGAVYPCTIDDPLAVAALAVSAQEDRHVVLANLGPVAREVTVGAQAVALGAHEVRVLHM